MLVIQPGEKLSTLDWISGDFADWIGTACGDPVKLRVVRPDQGQMLPPYTDVDRIVVTGSPAMVTDPYPWIAQAAAWLREAVFLNIPVLGICFGHQLLAHALGGLVRDNPNGLEVGIVPVRFEGAAQDDPLLHDLPSLCNLAVSHQQSVVTLPPESICLASSEKEPRQAFRVQGRRAWGVQFHPEFSSRIARGYIQFFEEALVRSGQFPARLGEKDCDEFVGTEIIRRFSVLRAGHGR